MNATCFLGVDPGKTGALALYDPAAETLEIEDVPTLNVDGKTLIDETALARLVDAWSGTVREVWLELVNAMPSVGGVRRGMGAQSAFNFGRGYGLIRGVCAANFLPIMDVTPGQWKRALGVPGKVSGGDDAGRLRASQLMPRHAHLWAKRSQHGRADAALIALFAARQHEKAAA
jgi:crossover junction endodeoxyribonuclease RuvC